MSSVAGDVGRNRAILGAFCTDEGHGHIVGPQVHSQHAEIGAKEQKGTVRTMRKTPRIKPLEIVDRNGIKTRYILSHGLLYKLALIRVFLLLLPNDVVEC